MPGWNVAAIAAACGALAAWAPPACAQGGVPATCSSIGVAVAMQTDGDDAIVAGRDGAIARIALVSDTKNSVSPGFTASIAKSAIACTSLPDVRGLAISAKHEIFVATGTNVHVFPADVSAESRSFSPALGPDESIVAIGLRSNGDVELAIASKMTSARAVRFAVFDASASGASSVPIESFAYAHLAGALSAISLTSEDDTFAYDDGGEILEFAAARPAVVKPKVRLYGPASLLRPAVFGPVRGSRQLALDGDGWIYAADDGRIVCIDLTGSGPQAGSNAPGPPPERLLLSPRDVHLDLVEGVATSSNGALYILSRDPDSGVASLIDVVAERPSAPVKLP